MFTCNYFRKKVLSVHILNLSHYLSLGYTIPKLNTDEKLKTPRYDTYGDGCLKLGFYLDVLRVCDNNLTCHL